MTPIHTPLASPAMRKMLVGLVIAFGLLTGCQDRELALSILNVKPLDPISCEPIATEDVFQTDGVVDLVVRDDYSINLTVRNNLDDIVQSKGFQRADSRLSVNGVVMKEAIIEYSTLDQLSAEIATKKRVPLSGTIPENSQFTLLRFKVLDSIMLQQIRNAQEFIFTGDGEARPLRTSVTLLVNISIKGETLDGRDAESNEFLFPIKVCNGCKISYPPTMLRLRGGDLTCPPPMIDPEAQVDDEGPGCEAAIGADNGIYDCQTCR